jgi:ring-1,2-phenylacetyl-CoA epoxidase subunit PaaC
VAPSNGTLLDAVVAMADDALVLSHRLAEWSGRAPFLEEDLALANTALDTLGWARNLFEYAGELGGRTEDEYAYARDADEFANLLICELPGDDFAATYARQALLDVFHELWFEALAGGIDPFLAGFGARAVKEARYHARHSGGWVLRLAHGTDESRQRISEAFALMWPYAGELFEDFPGCTSLPLRSHVRAPWTARVAQVLDAAGLDLPGTPNQAPSGGRAGRHTAHLIAMLEPMQALARAHPGARW